MIFNYEEKQELPQQWQSPAPRLLTPEVGLINMCFLNGSCRGKRVQLGWYRPQTINDADTFRPSLLHDRKSDLKANADFDSTEFHLRERLNTTTSIHINSHSDMWAHCLELLMHTLAVCPPAPSAPLPFHPAQCDLSTLSLFSVCAPFLSILSLITLLPFLFCLQDGVIIYRSRHSSFPAASQPPGSLTNFLPENQPFPVFPPWAAFDTKRQLVFVRSEISRMNVGQRRSAIFWWLVWTQTWQNPHTMGEGGWWEKDDRGD